MSSAESRAQLDEIEHHIGEENPKAAREQIARLIQRGESLMHTPKRGRRIPDLPPSRELLERPYRIIYTLDEARQQVQIETVMHYRQRLPKRLGPH